MARVARWNAQGVFDDAKLNAIAAANAIMDEVVVGARALCPVGTVTKEGGTFKWVDVSFTMRRATRYREKGQRIQFTAKRYSGAKPGSLRDTIRRRTLTSRPGNIRVYAGNAIIFYAHFVERGTIKMKARPFLRPAFNQKKGEIVSRIQRKVKE